MLFAKDLKVALATLVATVGLLGFGTASASVLLKDANQAGAQTPLYFAKEAYLNALGARGGLAVRATSTAELDGDVNVNDIDVLLAVGNTYYFRYDLSGPGCNATGTPAERSMCPIFTDAFAPVRPYIHGNYGDSAQTVFGQNLTRAGGGAGESHGLYSVRVEQSATDAEGLLGAEGLVPAGGWSL